MDKNAIWKWLILTVLVAMSLALVVPPLDKKDAAGHVIRPGKIRRGLDLMGGSSFVVVLDKERLEKDLRNSMPEATDEEIQTKLEETLDGAYDRALEVLRNRINGLGIEEPIIFSGNERITIQLPGADEVQRRKAEEIIKSVAFLEFRMVDKRSAELVGDLFKKNLAPEGYRIVTVERGTYYQRDISFPQSAMDDEYLERLKNFHVPDRGCEFLLEKDEMADRTVYRPHFVRIRRELTGEYLKDAAVDFRGLGQPVVTLSFNSEGASKFAKITKAYCPGGTKNTGSDLRQLAIVLDGTLYSAPTIRTEIIGGNAEISGNFTRDQANFLCNILKAGSLPAPVKIVEKRFVAPSLGADSIKSGMHAIIYGGICVILFMLVYYLACGIVANLALLLNMILLPLGMIVAAGFLGIFASNTTGSVTKLPVLTLPGIAGILLTIGMAVDANVLIFERLREELRTGKRFWSAITAAYDRAFVTIVDANLTTLLTGIILFIFGSGPIRGFAVTLCAGILVSMFTALVVTKLFFGVMESSMKIKTLKMLTIIKDTAIDFVGKRKIAAFLSVVLIVASCGTMITRGIKSPGEIFGIDFTGGSSVSFTFDNKEPVESVRNMLNNTGIKEVYPQYQKEMDGSDEFLMVRIGPDLINGEKPVEIAKSALLTGFPEAGFKISQEDEVGPQVGAELKKKAIWAIVWALVGIIVYISIRFEFGFAIGAIAALMHDVLITAGIYSLCGRQLSLPVVAALLTIVGYSVNDTIVVFDRIREDLKVARNKSFKEICNLSLNQTLRRTLLTSLTTLITVVMLLVFGGGAINDFALALFIGVIAGTYSSIFVATPVVLLWHRDKKPELGGSGK
ncbi:protein translocase subunit SecD [Verrucomicrobiota bacterium]